MLPLAVGPIKLVALVAGNIDTQVRNKYLKFILNYITSGNVLSYFSSL